MPPRRELFSFTWVYAWLSEPFGLNKTPSVFSFLESCTASFNAVCCACPISWMAGTIPCAPNAAWVASCLTSCNLWAFSCLSTSIPCVCLWLCAVSSRLTAANSATIAWNSCRVAISSSGPPQVNHPSGPSILSRMRPWQPLPERLAQTKVLQVQPQVVPGVLQPPRTSEFPDQALPPQQVWRCCVPPTTAAT